MIVSTNVDDCIMVGLSIEKIEAFVQSTNVGPGKLTRTDEGDTDKFLGIEITHLDDKRFKISQPFLIDRIVSFLNKNTNEYGIGIISKSTPVGKPLLHNQSTTTSDLMLNLDVWRLSIPLPTSNWLKSHYQMKRSLLFDTCCGVEDTHQSIANSVWEVQWFSSVYTFQ